MAQPADLREMVHDLKNRLSAIAMAASAIRKSDYDRELGDEMVEIIRQNVDRANEAIETFASNHAPGSS